MTRWCAIALTIATTVVLPGLARASCTGTPLEGLDGTGISDNTPAIQAAINTAFAAGGGAVVLKPGRYRMAGTLTLKRGVVLCGTTHGPFDFGPDPSTTTVAATFLVTNTTAPFITVDGVGAAVTDLLFHYPNQVPPTALAPTSYPFTIKVMQPGVTIERSTVTNAFQFLDIEVGRTIARDLNIGAFHCGILVDHAADHVLLSNIVHSVFWDIGAFASYPQPIDNWVLNSGYAFMILRADAIKMENIQVFSRYAGFYLAESPDGTQPSLMGYGTATNVDIDTCQYGIIAQASHLPGYKFANLDIGCTTSTSTGVRAIAQIPHGPNCLPSNCLPPVVLVNGGSIRGTWINGAFPAFTPPGKLVVRHVLGHDE